jgi:monovalent cation:H+ antiporter-2, CPA2 family
VLIAAASADTAETFVELGLVMLGLAVLSRAAVRVGLSSIPLFLIAGLAFGDGGLYSIEPSGEFVTVGAQIGVILLLLTLGLEYTAEELAATLRRSLPTGMADLVLNFPPGFVVGLVLGWDVKAAVLLGGITYISSSGIVAKVLADFGRLGNRETPVVLSLLVVEDLAMAIYLPAVAVMLAGQSVAAGAASISVALFGVVAILMVALRYGGAISRVVGSHSDEALLLAVLGLTLVVAGAAEQARISSAVGAFLVGIALSGPVSRRAAALVLPLRDLFAAIFFLFFGFEIDPSVLPAVAVPALVLAAVTGVTKFATGAWAARRGGIGPAGRRRAGAVLVARGEFSIVIANLGVTASLHPDLGPLAAAYVLVLAVSGPILARFTD